MLSGLESFRLCALLGPETRVLVPERIAQDIEDFLADTTSKH